MKRETWKVKRGTWKVESAGGIHPSERNLTLPPAYDRTSLSSFGGEGWGEEAALSESHCRPGLQTRRCPSPQPSPRARLAGRGRNLWWQCQDAPQRSAATAARGTALNLLGQRSEAAKVVPGRFLWIRVPTGPSTPRASIALQQSGRIGLLGRAGQEGFRRSTPRHPA